MQLLFALSYGAFIRAEGAIPRDFVAEGVIGNTVCPAKRISAKYQGFSCPFAFCKK